MLNVPFTVVIWNSCEADPTVLAKYVVALLRHDKGKELKSHCVEQLRDFLKDETEPFVDLLFTALEGQIWNLFFFTFILILNFFICNIRWKLL